MKQLEEKLKDLQEKGHKTVSIMQVLIWMSDIKHNAKVKALKRKENE